MESVVADEKVQAMTHAPSRARHATELRCPLDATQPLHFSVPSASLCARDASRPPRNTLLLWTTHLYPLRCSCSFCALPFDSLICIATLKDIRLLLPIRQSPTNPRPCLPVSCALSSCDSRFSETYKYYPRQSPSYLQETANILRRSQSINLPEFIQRNGFPQSSQEISGKGEEACAEACAEAPVKAQARTSANIRPSS